MTPALVAAAIAAPLLRPEPWSAVALQQASSPDGALHCSTAPNECKHSARASTGSRWPTEEVHARTLWPCTADGGGLSSVSAEPAALHSRLATFWSAPCIRRPHLHQTRRTGGGRASKLPATFGLGLQIQIQIQIESLHTRLRHPKALNPPDVLGSHHARAELFS